MITWHTIPCQGAVSVAYCRVDSTVLRRTTQPGVATEWASWTGEHAHELHTDDVRRWATDIEDHEWLPIDRDEAGRLLGAVTAETIVMGQIAALFTSSSDGEVGRAAALELSSGSMFLVASPTQEESRRSMALLAYAHNARLGWLP